MKSQCSRLSGEFNNTCTGGMESMGDIVCKRRWMNELVKFRYTQDMTTYIPKKWGEGNATISTLLPHSMVATSQHVITMLSHSGHLTM